MEEDRESSGTLLLSQRAESLSRFWNGLYPDFGYRLRGRFSLLALQRSPSSQSEACEMLVARPCRSPRIYATIRGKSLERRNLGLRGDCRLSEWVFFATPGATPVLLATWCKSQFPEHAGGIGIWQLMHHSPFPGA